MRPVWVPTFVHGRPEALAPFVRLFCADRLAGWHGDSGDSGPVPGAVGYGQREEEGLEGGLRDVGDGTDEEVQDGERVGCGGKGDLGENGRGEKGWFYQATEVLDGGEMREGCAEACEDHVDGFGRGREDVAVSWGVLAVRKDTQVTGCERNSWILV